MLLRVPRAQQTLRYDPRALESNRSRVRIPLTKRAFRKTSSHRRSVPSSKPRQSGPRQFHQSFAKGQLQYLQTWSKSRPIAIPSSKLRPGSDLQRHPVSKSVRSWPALSFSLPFATGREIARVSLSSPGSAVQKQKKLEGPTSLTLSLTTTVRFAKAWCRCSDDLNSKAFIVRRSEI